MLALLLCELLFGVLLDNINIRHFVFHHVCIQARVIFLSTIVACLVLDSLKVRQYGGKSKYDNNYACSAYFNMLVIRVVSIFKFSIHNGLHL